VSTALFTIGFQKQPTRLAYRPFLSDVQEKFSELATGMRRRNSGVVGSAYVVQSGPLKRAFS
jgi:hypothetical protein